MSSALSGWLWESCSASGDGENKKHVWQGWLWQTSVLRLLSDDKQNCHLKVSIALRIVYWLAEMEFIFPIAALTVLVFALVARRVLITHWCFGHI